MYHNARRCKKLWLKFLLYYRLLLWSGSNMTRLIWLGLQSLWRYFTLCITSKYVLHSIWLPSILSQWLYARPFWFTSHSLLTLTTARWKYGFLGFQEAQRYCWPRQRWDNSKPISLVCEFHHSLQTACKPSRFNGRDGQPSEVRHSIPGFKALESKVSI